MKGRFLRGLLRVRTVRWGLCPLRMGVLAAAQASERIARIRVAALEAAAEPLRALRRGAVRELVGANLAGHLGLDAVVADGGRGRQPVLNIARLEKATLRCAVPPHAGKAVRLKLERHGQLVRCAGAGALHLPDALLAACAWFAETGDLDAASRHARSAHDIALTGRLVWSGTMRCLGRGETDRGDNRPDRLEE